MILNLQFINRDSEDTYYINWTKNAGGSPRRISYNTFVFFILTVMPPTQDRDVTLERETSVV